MRKIITSLLPSTSLTLCFLILPVIATIYFVITRYSERFAAEQNITYLDVQNNWLGQLLLDQQWLGWFNRFMDFALWGMIAAVILLGGWAIASAKVIFKNHFTQEEFTNFSNDKVRWHSHFFTVFVVKALLVLTAFYFLISIISQQLPQLSVAIVGILNEPSTENVLRGVVAGFLIFLYQYLIAAAVKLLKHLRIE